MSSRTESLVYGTVLVLAIGGGGYALWGAAQANDTPSEEQYTAASPAPATPAVERSASARAAASASSEAEEAAAAALPEGMAAPVMPDVPDLATQPPPAIEEPSDPRFATLGVEMRLMSRARDLVADHPSLALELLQQHRTEHRDGVLREAREAFTIEALIAMERRSEAERRYYDFLDEFENSEFQSRLADLLRRQERALPGAEPEPGAEEPEPNAEQPAPE